MHKRSCKFPFSAIVGQEEAKKVLLLNIINPKIGGVLLCGEKGTAKSTLVRSAAELCGRRYLELPLSVTEDRLVGAVDLERTIEEGKICLEPGILGNADNGIVYIDEVNLLPDHIVDILLNVSADKMNRVEREGISAVQDCDFILIGTMNGEEGFLRPQFLDRFGLFVFIQSEKDPQKRVEILKRKQAYDDCAETFISQYEEQEASLAQAIKAARQMLPRVTVTEQNRKDMVAVCLEANIDGHRGDLVLQETAKAIAAWNLHTYITKDDIDEAAHYALAHRRKNADSPEDDEHQHQHEEEEKQQENQEQEQQPEEEKNQEQQPDDQQDDSGSGQQPQQQTEETSQDAPPEETEENTEENGDTSKPQSARMKQQVFEIGKPFKVKKFGFRSDRKPRTGQGKRTQIRSASKSGQYIFSTSMRKYNDLALDATIRAAAPFQSSRDRRGMAIAIENDDIREKVRQKKVSNFLVFVVDGSGSIGVDRRMAEAKAAVFSILQDAYVKRDKVAMVVFHGSSADVVLPPTRSVQRGYTLLETIQTGGKTPLNAGISKAVQVIKSEYAKNKNILPMMILITDGKGNVPLKEGENPRKELIEIAEQLSEDKTIASMVIDIEKSNLMSFGIAKRLAVSLKASYYKLDDLKSDTLLEIIDQERLV